MGFAVVRYQVATYSGEVTVYFSDANMEDDAIIAKAKRIVTNRSGGSILPFGYESWRIIERDNSETE